MKRVVKMDVKYLDAMIDQLKILAGMSNQQVLDFCSVSKNQAILNVAAGLERTLDRAVGRREGYCS